MDGGRAARPAAARQGGGTRVGRAMVAGLGGGGLQRQMGARIACAAWASCWESGAAKIFGSR